MNISNKTNFTEVEIPKIYVSNYTFIELNEDLFLLFTKNVSNSKPVLESLMEDNACS